MSQWDPPMQGGHRVEKSFKNHCKTYLNASISNPKIVFHDFFQIQRGSWVQGCGGKMYHDSSFEYVIKYMAEYPSPERLRVFCGQGIY